MPAFVFDFGGVLLRWQPLELMRQCLPQRVGDEASARTWVKAFFEGFGGDWGAFDQGLIDADETLRRISTRTGLSATETQRVLDAVGPHLSLVPESVALLATLREAGVPLYYLSNMPAPYADYLQRTHAPLGWFNDGVFSSRVRLSKPDPAIFALAAGRFGHPPGELVFLDDHPANVRAAEQAGWHALRFHDAAQAQAELRGRGLWPLT